MICDVSKIRFEWTKWTSMRVSVFRTSMLLFRFIKIMFSIMKFDQDRLEFNLHWMHKPLHMLGPPISIKRICRNPNIMLSFHALFIWSRSKNLYKKPGVGFQHSTPNLYFQVHNKTAIFRKAYLFKLLSPSAWSRLLRLKD